MENRDSGTIYFIAGLLFGGIVGASIGILMAPADAETTRANLKVQGGKLLKKSLTAIETFEKEKLTPAINKISAEVKGKVIEAKADGLDKTVSKIVSVVQSKVQPKKQ